MTEPLVSIATPVYNDEVHLGECIESVLAQTYENWQYVICDNRSTDGTPAVVDRYMRTEPRIQYRRYEEFVDVLASHNRAVAAVDPSSRYCKILGADDWLYPTHLAELVAVGESDPAVGVVGSFRLAGDRVDLTGLPYGSSRFPGQDVLGRSLRYSLEGKRLSVLGSPSALLMRTDLVKSRSPFYDESLRHGDTEAIFWLLRQSDFGYVHQVLSFSREPEEAETARSNELGSAVAERILMTARYAYETLPAEEAQAELHAQVAIYARWHLRQRLKPSRLRDTAFHAFHRDVIDRILAEGGLRDAGDRRRLRRVRGLLR